jgi:UDP-N-acetylmuramate dehydrogenase
MKLFAGLEKIAKYDVPLAPATWLRIGGPAKYFIEPTNLDELTEVVRRCRDSDVAMYVLGRGANLLVDDAGVDGAVIRLLGEQFTDARLEGDRFRAGAGADMGRIVLACVRGGLSGLEALAGIPGSVGGCIKMNAGGAFGDIGNAVESVEVMTVDGETYTRHRGDLAFAYRSTNISAKFILSAEFRVTEDDPHRILREVKQIWVYKKNAQPLSNRNAGCIFKNPRGLSAGALIDRAGLKGKRVGGAHVSDKHANFILADPGTTSADMMKLIDRIREKVYRKAEVYLELEIEVW